MPTMAIGGNISHGLSGMFAGVGVSCRVFLEFTIVDVKRAKLIKNQTTWSRTSFLRILFSKKEPRVHQCRVEMQVPCILIH